ncbi:short-chain dehydrogenase/reductase [Xylariaceae sp. FL0662B]|nr:short-chain dehydrogenase/reductase [Xylariaceae sp. FL0662B]
MAPPKKSVLITGCSAGGIGAGLAEAFQQKGYFVFATLRDLSKAPENFTNAPNVKVLQLDVLLPESIAAAVESVAKETGGRLDVLVNNSGRNFVMPGLDTSIEDARKIFDINVFAPLAMIKAFAPLLVKARGCVVNQASFAGRMAMPFLSLYNGSKAALIMASDTWRRELEPLGVRSITLVTTSVKTLAFDKAQMPRIPETSYYYVIRDYVYRLADGRLQDGAPDPLTYGLEVVRAVDAGKVGEVWVGKDAGMNHWLWRLLPSSMFDSILNSFMKYSAELAKVAEVMKTAK